MNKTNFKLTTLEHGNIAIYDFGDVVLHSYMSNDAMNDQVLIVEKGDRAVAIENPSFVDSGKELSHYVKEAKLNVVGKILSYHMTGAQFLPEVPVYSTKKAINFAMRGAGAAMVNNFEKVFGKNFDSSLADATNIVKGKTLVLGGLHFKLINTTDAFDVKIADINVLYTHMLGGDTHSIVPSLSALKTMVKRLEKYKLSDYALVFSAHHTPESSDDIRAKIDYLIQLQGIAAETQTADSFTSKMKQAFPDYTGNHYLEMTAGFLFPKD